MFQPESVVERPVDCVEACAPIDRYRFVPLDAQLRVDALKQGGSKFEHALSKILRHRLSDGPVEVRSAMSMAIELPVRAPILSRSHAFCSSELSLSSRART